MQQKLEHQIRERAYHLWLAEGGHDGAADRHWLAAEREVLAATASAMPATKARTTRRSSATVASAAKAPAKLRRRAC